MSSLNKKIYIEFDTVFYMNGVVVVDFSCVSISPSILGVFLSQNQQTNRARNAKVAVGFLHALPSASRLEGYVRSACSELKT